MIDLFSLVTLCQCFWSSSVKFIYMLNAFNLCSVLDGTSGGRVLSFLGLYSCTVSRFKSRTFTRAAAALKPILATDSRLRLRGGRLKPERELVKEQREAAHGVMGVWGTLRPSTSSMLRNALPRASGSTICKTKQWVTITRVCLFEPCVCVNCEWKSRRVNIYEYGTHKFMKTKLFSWLQVEDLIIKLVFHSHVDE